MFVYVIFFVVGEATPVVPFQESVFQLVFGVQAFNAAKLLKGLADKKGTKKDLKRIIAIGSLIETTDFLNISLKQKNIIKENMVWCNKQYKKYLDSQK